MCTAFYIAFRFCETPFLLLFVIYSLMGNVMSDMTNPTESDYTICIENEPEEFKGLYEGFGKSVLIYEPESKEIALKMLEDMLVSPI